MAQQTIEITDTAAKRLKAMLEEQQKQEGQGLRIKVVGGGCSGLTYKMDFDLPREGDRVFERDMVKVLVDRKSFLYLRGTELDYSESLMDTGFKLQNPNVKRTCGCGNSFSV